MAPKTSIWDKQIRMAMWKQHDAVALANKLLPFVGKRVLLYGGGGPGRSIGRLVDIKVKIPKYYRDDKGQERTHFPTGVFMVQAKLTDLDPPLGRVFRKRYTEVVGRRTFEPCLGSWQIAPIINNKAMAIT